MTRDTDGMRLDCPPIPELATFRAAYIEALLGSETDENSESGDDNFEGEEDNLSPEAYADIFTDTWGFFETQRELFAGHEALAGHDFALTRNGHGAGFWDRPDVYGDEAAKALTEASRPYGTQGLYRGDDGKLYTHS